MFDNSVPERCTTYKLSFVPQKVVLKFKLQEVGSELADGLSFMLC